MEKPTSSKYQKDLQWPAVATAAVNMPPVISKLIIPVQKKQHSAALTTSILCCSQKFCCTSELLWCLWLTVPFFPASLCDTISATGSNQLAWMGHWGEIGSKKKHLIISIKKEGAFISQSYLKWQLNKLQIIVHHCWKQTSEHLRGSNWHYSYGKTRSIPEYRQFYVCR